MTPDSIEIMFFSSLSSSTDLFMCKETCRWLEHFEAPFPNKTYEQLCYFLWTNGRILKNYCNDE